MQGDKNHNDTEPVLLEAIISRRLVIVTADSKSKTYGDADPEFTWTQEGLVEGDPLNVTLKREAGENVGGYPILPGEIVVSDDYDRGFNEGLLTIEVREATVTAVDQAITEGEAISTDVSMATLSGGAEGDRLVAIILTASAANAADAATGTITASGAKIVNAAGEDVTGNYKLTYAPGKLTVNPKPTEAPTDKPTAKPDYTLLARMSVSGSSKTTLKLAWTKVADADGYDIFFARCSKGFKLKKTVKASATRVVRFRKLDKRECYKAYVKAWKKVGGKKVYIGKASPQVHAVSGGYTNHACNTRSVTLNKSSLTLKVGRSAALKAKVKGVKSGMKVVQHVKKVRFYSSNTNVATVTSGGRVKAVGKGRCTIYAMANNGVRSSVKVTVK